jgi:predicted O-methyltransferase YrrM
MAMRDNGGGEVHHTVWDDKLSDIARENLSAMGLDRYVRFHVSEAVAALKSAEGQLDLVFNDIDKEQYPDSIPVIASKLRDGGALIIDNTLWDGRVMNPTDTAASTEGIRQCTKLLCGEGWVSSLVPLRDGVTLAIRTSAKLH